MNGGLCSWRDKTCVPPWMFVFSYCISLLFHRSNRKVFVGTFVIPFKITLMCQICWKPCLPLGLKLVGWLFTEKIAGYDSPSWWGSCLSSHSEFLEKELQWVTKGGFSACLPVWWHLYAFKQGSYALKLTGRCSVNQTTQITQGHLPFCSRSLHRVSRSELMCE